MPTGGVEQRENLRVVATTRMAKRFDWNEVDPKAIRAMLVSAYLTEGREDEAEALRGLGREHLADRAERSLGRPPSKRYFTPDMTTTLLETWLPKADKEAVKQLVMVVQAGSNGTDRTAVLRSKADRIAFLQQRRRTKNLIAAVRSAFVSTHKVSVEVATTVPGPLGEPATMIPLVGQDLMSDREPYPHQVEAWRRLDEEMATGSRLSGRIVLPTGSGKTDTAAMWLLRQMAADPTIRVLWISHQQELLDQAVTRFQALARTLPDDFYREARRIYAGASAVSTLASPTLDLAAITIQSLSRVLTGPGNALDVFLERPTFVVVDEAHRAGSPTYDTTLERIVGSPSVRAVIGLTATPYPTATLAQQAFASRFPVSIAEEDASALTSSGILARPVLWVVDTSVRVELTATERSAATSGDLTVETLQRLDDPDRNALVVDTWAATPDEWGKTLVFATSIDHAEELTHRFATRGVPSRVLHSRIPGGRADVLGWFRKLREPGVLVSVGMLTEGVDLPDARTAFLARPTVSRVLMQQMIGRVLRGPRAGGEAEANIVYLRDHWNHFGDVLEPGEVIQQPTVRRGPGQLTQRPLPTIALDDDGRAIPPDVAYQVGKQIDPNGQDDGLDPSGSTGQRSIDPMLTASELVGYYRLPDRSVPVFSHQRDAYRTLLSEALEYDLRGNPFLAYFEELPPPYPTRRTLTELVDFTRGYGEPPEFIDLTAQIGPLLAVRQLMAAGTITEVRRFELITEIFETSIASQVFPSFGHFCEAVNEELVRRYLADASRRPEEPLTESAPGARLLPRVDRDLESALDLAVATGRRILPVELADRLDPPPVVWTRSAVSSTLGHWSMRLSGPNAGQQVIRINRLLRTSTDAVSDEMLAYLIYHELLHHLLPSQGHDAEFRLLEARWPEAAALDERFATLHERWNTRAASYTDE